MRSIALAQLDNGSQRVIHPALVVESYANGVFSGSMVSYIDRAASTFYFDIETQDITDAKFEALVSIEEFASIYIAQFNLMTTISFPVLDRIVTSSGTLQIYRNNLLTKVEFPLLTRLQLGDAAHTNNFVINLNPSLTQLSFPSLSVVAPGATAQPSFDFSQNALSRDTVNGILVLFSRARQGSNPAILDLSGGTNAAPTGAGLTAKTSLENAGWTVSVN